jgi:hypothetical protein
MGTRGFVGFVVDGSEKITYNHSDSYPGGLGLDVLNWLRRQDISEVREATAKLRVVDGDKPSTHEDIESVGLQYANTRVSSGKLSEWYVLLRETQGNPEAILDAGVMIDGQDFPYDSLFCEFGYLVDLDKNVFEVYAGFQQEAHDKGRFAKRTGEHLARDGYAPVALVASWPFDNLPTDDEFMTELDHL